MSFLLALLTGCSTTIASVPPGTYDPTHTRWDTLLRQNVQSGDVNYTAIRANPTELNAYLGELSGVTTTEGWPRTEALAFWINAYNAWTVRLIVDHPNTTSIRKITLGSPWMLSFIPMHALDKDVLSLDDIEHRILRTQFADPRIHMAIVCASISCPVLRSEAYTADHLEAQLDDQARLFLSDPQRNTLNPDKKTLQLSSIFKWFEEDFTVKGGISGFVQAYGPPELARAAAEGWSITYLDYNWGLNGK